MDDVDRQIEELERVEDARQSVSEQIEHMPRYGGSWIEDGRLFVGIAGLPADCVVTFKPAKHTIEELESLSDRLGAAADRLDAPISSYGVDHQLNAVVAEAEDLDDERIRALRDEFAGEPVEWSRGGPILLAGE